MQLDKDGHRIEKFSPDVAYELSAGAYIDVVDESRYGFRYQKALQCFSGRPFFEVPETIEAEMEKHLCRLKKWDADYLRTNGDRVQLGA